MTAGTASGSPAGGRQDISGALTSVVLRYVRGRLGDDGVARVLALAGEARPAAVLEDPTSWSTHEEAIRLFDAAGHVTGDTHVGRHVGEEMLRQHDGTEVANLLRSLGSPGELLRNVTAAAAKFSTVSTMEALEVGEAHAVLRATARPGLKRHIQLCEFTKGLLSQVPVLFGLVPAVVAESECQARGGRFCLYSAAWEARQWSSFVDSRTSLFSAAWSDEGVVEARSEIELDHPDHIAALERQVVELTTRLEGVYSTAADLLGTEDIDGVLARITARAANALNAPGYLLVVRTSPEAEYRMHHRGFSPPEAEALARELLADPPDNRGGSRLIVDIGSSRRHYGRLVAVYPDGMQFFAQERQTLELYADYAATALDVVTALDEARRSNATARALLDFSRALSGARTVDEVVTQLLDTVPTVVGCDWASAMLWDPESETLTVRRPDTSDGVDDPTDDGQVIHRSATPLVDQMLTHREIVVLDRMTDDAFVHAVLEESGTASAVVAPLFSGEAFLGLVSANFGVRMDEALHTDRDLHERLLGLADHAVTALRNARLLEQIRYMAWHDSLTGLPNRRLLGDRAALELERAKRTGETVCMFFVDLDRFKDVNDLYGHACGDELLEQVARRLTGTVRRCDTVARLGGDEFALLLPGLSDPTAISDLAGRALEALCAPYTVGGRQVLASASIGVALAPMHAHTYDELLSAADAAMYQSKDLGRNTYRVFSAAHSPKTSDDAGLEAELRDALEHGQLFVLYQPFMDLESASIVGVEALARWRHPSRGVIEPASFIPVAERTDLIVAIDSWIVHEASRQVRQWADAGLPLLRLAVNVSGRDLSSDRFVEAVTRAVGDRHIEAGGLELEITEQVVMDETDPVRRNVERLRQLGVRFSIDDFGSGRAGLGRIGSFPASTLKIDRSFVQVLGPEDASSSLVSAIVGLARNLGIDCVAEGVETPQQRRVLLQRGCSIAQGFFFSPPLPPEQLERALADSTVEVHSAPGT